jgi:hypothetical protein
MFQKTALFVINTVITSNPTKLRFLMDAGEESILNTLPFIPFGNSNFPFTIHDTKVRGVQNDKFAMKLPLISTPSLINHRTI